jgi:hypothetical protein
VRLTVGVLLALLMTVHAARASDFLEEQAVVYRDGCLSGELRGVSLEHAIATVARETGIEVRGRLLDSREIHARFERVPLAEALGRLLGRQNFTLRYGARGEPQAIDLGGVPLPRRSPASVPKRLGRQRPAARRPDTPSARRPRVLGWTPSAGTIRARR